MINIVDLGGVKGIAPGLIVFILFIYAVFWKKLPE